MSGYIFENSMAPYDLYGYQVDFPYGGTNYVPYEYPRYNHQPSYLPKPLNRPQLNFMRREDILGLFEMTNSMVESDIRNYEKRVPLNSPLISQLKGLINYYIESVDYYVARMRERGDEHSRWEAEEMLDKGMKTLSPAKSLLRRACCDDDDDVIYAHVVSDGPIRFDMKVDSTPRVDEVCPLVTITPKQPQEVCENLNPGSEKFGSEETNIMEDIHLKVLDHGQPLTEKIIEINPDGPLALKEASFPLDFFVINTDEEHPNPIIMMLGKYFLKVPRAKAQMILYVRELDGSYSEYSLKNHARKAIPFDNG